MSNEVEEYKQPPAVANNKDFDVLGYWRDAGSPRLDPHGNVMAAAQFPIIRACPRVPLHRQHKLPIGEEILAAGVCAF